MNDETAIRDLITRWVDAVGAQDLDGVLANHDPDIVMFDVPPPYDGVRGIEAYRGSWAPFFDWLSQGCRVSALGARRHRGHRRRVRPRAAALRYTGRVRSQPRQPAARSRSGCARTTAAGSLCTNIIRSRWWTRPRNPGIEVRGGYAVALVIAARRRVCTALFAAGLVGRERFRYAGRRRRRPGLERAVLALALRRREDGHQHGRPPIRAGLQRHLHVRDGLLTRYLRRHGRRRPRPANPTLPLPPQYTWNGATWVHIYEWQWDCFMGDGVPKEWNPARSVAYYTPQPDGTLRGSWRTDIYGGPCDGSVIMDVAAFPAG